MGAAGGRVHQVARAYVMLQCTACRKIFYILKTADIDSIWQFLDLVDLVDLVHQMHLVYLVHLVHLVVLVHLEVLVVLL